MRFVKHVNTWLGPNPEELLQLLHPYEGSEAADFDESDESQYSTLPILDGKLYAELERKRASTKPAAVDTKEIHMRTLEKIHNKAIFEAFNEALDYERVYGLRGKPFPWKVTHEKISEKPLGHHAIPRILQRAKTRVIDWSKHLCGMIIEDKDPHAIFPQDEVRIAQVKEEKLTRLLSEEVCSHHVSNLGILL